LVWETKSEDVVEMCKNKLPVVKEIKNEVDKKTDERLRKDGYEQGEAKYEAEGVCQKICYPKMKNVMLGYENKKGEKLFGGIVTNTDRNYRGRWICFARART